MSINKIFTIRIEKLHFDGTRISGYDVSIYSEELEDFDSVYFKVMDSPFEIQAKQYSLSPSTIDIILEHYISITDFINDLTGYLKNILIKNEIDS